MNTTLPQQAKSIAVSKLRQNALRFVFGLNAVGLTYMAWSAIFAHEGSWEFFQAVAFSFWAAIAALMFMGLQYPLKMLPLLMLQMLYKLIWLAIYALPQMGLETFPSRTIKIFVAAIVVDLIVVPWPYVLRNFVLKRRQDFV